MSEEWKNKLYYGDNLNIMREHVVDESVDLIYLDPPFNSKANYNVLFKEVNGSSSDAQITVFEDTWHWNMESESTYNEIVTKGTKKLSDLIQALRQFLGINDMMAYLTMMAIRLVEMHRVLKPTGSIYLHCDPTASHYIKLLLDAVFGGKNFRNEIVWHYRRWTASSKKFQRLHDIVLFYTKGNDYTFNQLLTPYTEGSVKRKEQGILNRFKRGEDPVLVSDGKLQAEGVPENDVWQIPFIPPSAKERLGYPTQKPEALLERIIKASSNEGDIIMDPFCGCGTTISVAEHLNRKWIGVDITHLAITLIRNRLHDAYESELLPYEVIGDPKDIHGAEALAEQDKYQFEWWALGLADARPAHDKKKGADAGIDGYINFFDDNTGKAKTIIISVKGGHVTVSQIRDLKGVLEREKAVIGVFITLQEPTRPMKEEAAASGFYIPEHFPKMKCPRIQILTIEELLNGKQLEYPRLNSETTFKKAKRKQKGEVDEQMELEGF
ncbi:MAG: DNA methyltransferase [Candidatus Theseobacter exili]|nr:DNA methyltransferase [Candidatus Theseobacter exili]